MDKSKQDRKEEYSDEDFYSDKSWDDERPNMCCPYMNYSPNMCGCPYMMQGMNMNLSMMNQQQMQQPMMGREYDDQFEDEDMSRRRHHHHYYYPPYGYPSYMYGHMYHKPRPY